MASEYPRDSEIGKLEESKRGAAHWLVRVVPEVCPRQSNSSSFQLTPANIRGDSDCFGDGIFF